MEEAQVLEEVMMLPKADAIRYRLNRFIDQDNAWIDIDDFVSLPRIDLSVMPQAPVLCVDRTPEWTGATITASWVENDRVNSDILLSLVDPTFEKLTEAVKTVASQVPYSKIVMDGYSLGDLSHNLQKQGFVVSTLTKKDVVNATGLLRKTILEDKLSHSHHEVLVSQMRRASVKEIGEGEYRIVRTSTDVELDAVLATVLGCYQALVDAESEVQVF